jgi:hypothetical protein
LFIDLPVYAHNNQNPDDIYLIFQIYEEVPEEQPLILDEKDE